VIPVTQTRRGGPDAPIDERGDCFDACLASVLEVPIAETFVRHGDGWWDAAQQVVARHGYRLIYALDRRTKAVEVAEWFGLVYWIAGVPSLNLGTDENGQPVMHVIVMRGDQIVHDPSLGDRYPLGPVDDEFEVHDAILLVELEPRAVAA
jgi:hypothetical protein